MTDNSGWLEMGMYRYMSWMYCGWQGSAAIVLYLYLKVLFDVKMKAMIPGITSPTVEVTLRDL